MTAYITVPYLKERLNNRAIPLPNDGDTDYAEIIDTASNMVRDRCTSFDETAPPAAVKRVTLILAMRMRVNESMLHSDADGKPVQVALWTQDLADILGSLVTQDTPDETIHAPVQGTLAVPAEHLRGYWVQRHRGRRGTWRGTP